MKRPAFSIACALVAGAVCGRVIVLPWYIAAGAIVLLLGGAVYLWARSGRAPQAPAPRDSAPQSSTPQVSVPRVQSTVTRLVLGAFFALALLQQNAEVRRERLAERQVGGLQRAGALTFRGTVAEEPTVSRAADRVLLVLRNIEIAGAPQSSASHVEHLACRVQVSLLRSAATAVTQNLPCQGQRIEITGTLRKPISNPHQDLFDYSAYLRTRGISAQVSVWGPGRARRVEEEDAPLETSVFSRLMGWRRGVLHRMDQSLEPEKAAVAKAMLFGDTSGFDDGLRSVFIKAGIAHLFAVSGSHTAMLALIVFCLCRLLQIPPRVSVVVLFVLMAIFCALVGFLPPVMRGTIMAYCMALPILSRRAVDSLEAFSLAVVLSLLVSPLSILRTDFQLSYLCVLGMITLSPTLSEILSVPITRWNSYSLRRLAIFYNKWLASGLSFVIAVTLALIPVLSLYFHQVSLIGIAANLVLVPFSGLFLLAAAAFSVLGTVSGELSQALAPLLSWASGTFTAMTRFFAGVPYAVTYLPPFSWWMILVYYLLLFSGPHIRLLRAPGAKEIRRGRLLLRAAAIAAIVAWWPVLARVPALAGEPDPGFQLTMLDVGQGDCFVLRLPDARVMIVDAGKPQAARTILQYLQAQNVDEVAALLLTHSDADHIGAAPRILDELYVGTLLVGSSVSDTRDQRNLDEAVARRKVPVCHVARGDKLGGARDMRLEILSPAREADAEEMASQRLKGFHSGRPDPNLLSTQHSALSTPKDPNNQSVVLLAEYGEMTILLTGDAEIPVEKEMLRVYGAKALEAEVLKPGHHGSRTASSEEFIEAVHPKVALVSAGARNQYGHPAPEVVERLRRAGATVLNTADCASVDLRTDGHRLWVRVTRQPQDNVPDGGEKGKNN